jgi:hypothetical protein
MLCLETNVTSRSLGGQRDEVAWNQDQRTGTWAGSIRKWSVAASGITGVIGVLRWSLDLLSEPRPQPMSLQSLTRKVSLGENGSNVLLLALFGRRARHTLPRYHFLALVYPIVLPIADYSPEPLRRSTQHPCTVIFSNLLIGTLGVVASRGNASEEVPYQAVSPSLVHRNPPL